MNFLHPQFLFGLLALAIPIIIHLFNFRRTKRIYFSSTRFLRNIKESNSSRLKLKHWLILASRLLFVFFLVLAFAQPFVPVDSGEKISNVVKIYVDNSYSMSNETNEGIVALDHAVQYVEEIVQQYPKSTKFQLLTNEFAINSESLVSYDVLLDALTEVAFSSISRDLDEAISRLERSNTASATDADIFLISDFQKSTSLNVGSISLDSSHSYFLVPISSSKTANLFIDSIFLTNPFLLADNTNEINIRIRNTGEEPVDDVILRLFVNEAQVATGAVTINGASTTTTKFNINFDLKERNRCKISFEDFPVTYDNDFYFSLNTVSKIDVLEISGDNASEVLKYVYGNKELFSYQQFSANNLDYNLLNNADLVFINEVTTFNDAIKPYLQQYVENGGTIVLIFGEQPVIEAFDFLNLPESLKLADTHSSIPEKIAQPDLSNPFFMNVFESKEEDIYMPQSYNTVSWGSTGMNILNYRDGSPYFSRSSKDNVYYLGAPLKDKFTNFHKQALFVPIMYRLAALSQSYNEQLYHYISDAQIEMKKEGITAEDILKLERENQEIIPTQFIVGNKVFLEVPKFILSPGFYDLKEDDKTAKVLAFNFNKEESRLDQYTQDELNSLLGNQAKIFDEDNLASFSQQLRDRQQGEELWKYCLILALLCLLAEVLFIRFL